MNENKTGEIVIAATPAAGMMYTKIPVGNSQAITELKGKIASQLAILQGFGNANLDINSRNLLFDAIQGAKKVIGEIGAARLEITRLIDLEKNKIMTTEKGLKQPLQDEIDKVSNLVRDFDRKQAEDREKAQIAATRSKQAVEFEEAIRKSIEEPTQNPVPNKFIEDLEAEFNTPPTFPVTTPTQPTKPAPAPKGVKKVWSYKIVDLDKIPREFFTLDEKALAEAVKKGANNIPGVYIFEEEITKI